MQVMDLSGENAKNGTALVAGSAIAYGLNMSGKKARQGGFQKVWPTKSAALRKRAARRAGIYLQLNGEGSVLNVIVRALSFVARVSGFLMLLQDCVHSSGNMMLILFRSLSKDI